ncbi:MAG: acylneuraminate cytidylyltransferase family protein [Chthoniobacter sp.]|uniref:acylneuraminate cytidylyltransferase family protein n=1 Tax=Chthoniobacter sp. TaxID=2510640 RepID=UPI0032A60A2F
MHGSPDIVALIPARGGSKAVPRKNVLPVAGKPLIAWTIEAALRSANLSKVIVSTDNDEIAEVATRYGAEVPFMRPAELATDAAGSLGVVLHALDWLAAQGGEPDYLLLLQPTSPLRTSADIDGAARLAIERQADAVLGICEATPHPWLTCGLSPDGKIGSFFGDVDEHLPRQQYPPAYVLNGAIYLNRPASLRATRSFQPPGALGYIMPVERSLDIDSPWEMRIVDVLLRHTEN